MTQHQTVCAIIVTYNRKALLADCIDAVLRQSHRVERILVIDNASTDGTRELLQESGRLQNRAVLYHVLPENRGGAGGFHEGFRLAMESGSEWIWPMDDDGVPDNTCLEHLLAADTAGLFRGPLVRAREDASGEQLAFSGRSEADEHATAFTTVRGAKAVAVNGLLPGFVAPFNGVLIHRDVVRRIGFPRANFFIWGDEWDYFLRAKRIGAVGTTVVSAGFQHPADRTPTHQVRFAGRDWDVLAGGTPFRQYLIVRNYAYIKSRNYGFAAWVKHTLKYLFYNWRRDRSFSSWQILMYSLEGLSGRLHGHSRFLNGRQ